MWRQACPTTTMHQEQPPRMMTRQHRVLDPPWPNQEHGQSLEPVSSYIPLEAPGGPPAAGSLTEIFYLLEPSQLACLLYRYCRPPSIFANNKNRPEGCWEAGVQYLEQIQTQDIGDTSQWREGRKCAKMINEKGF